MTIHDDNIFLHDSRLIFLWFVVVVVVNVRMNNKQMSGRRQQNKQKSYRKIPSKISEFVTHTNSNRNFQWRAKKCLKNFFFVLCVFFFLFLLTIVVDHLIIYSIPIQAIIFNLKFYSVVSLKANLFTILPIGNFPNSRRFSFFSISLASHCVFTL